MLRKIVKSLNLSSIFKSGALIFDLTLYFVEISFFTTFPTPEAKPLKSLELQIQMPSQL
jgi:hypothetical protein